MPITITIKNRRPATETLFLMLWGGDVQASITPKTSIQLPASGNDFTFTLDKIGGGRVYVSINEALDTDSEPDGANPGLKSHHIRFDKVEFSFPGSANLTAVDFFGIPFAIQTFKDNQVKTSLSYHLTANDLISKLSKLSAGSAVVWSDAGTFVRLLSPVKASAEYANAQPSMQSYVDSVAKAAVSLTINGTFFGNPPVPYSFQGAFGAGGSIQLTSAGDTIVVSGATLAQDIYTCNGEYSVNGATHHVGDNDRFAAVYRDLVGGFNLGYVNSPILAHANDSSTWWTSPPFERANTMFNPYAQVVTESSDAYGFPFSDLQKKVLAPLNPGEVDRMEITILPDDANPQRP